MMRLGDRGDTIVEVLIAIAIVGMVLGGAYASANRSLQANRRAQERSEAMRVAEQQLERLKVSAKQYPEIFTEAPYEHFCVATDGSPKPFNGAGGAPPTSYTSDNFSLTPSGDYPVDCRISYSGGAYHYYAWINRLANNTFAVHVRWDGAGNLKQEAVISYRVYP